MAAAHEGYARRRWKLLSVEDRSIAEDRNWAGMLRDEVAQLHPQLVLRLALGCVVA